MESSRWGEWASIFENAKPVENVRGAVTVQLSDWAAKLLAKYFRAMETIEEVGRPRD